MLLNFSPRCTGHNIKLPYLNNLQLYCVNLTDELAPKLKGTRLSVQVFEIKIVCNFLNRIYNVVRNDDDGLIGIFCYTLYTPTFVIRL